MRKLTISVLTVVLLFFVGVGCGVQPVLPVAETATESAQDHLTPQPALVAAPAACPTPEDGQALLHSPEYGYCLLYPADYTLAQPSSDVLEIVRGTVMNHIDPRVSIHVEDSVGRNLDQVVQQLEDDYVPPGFTAQRRSITVDGVEAVVLDNLPGQDLNRRVAFIHNGWVYHLFFAPIGEEGSQVRRQAETLYQQLLDSFRFLDIPATVSESMQLELGTADEHTVDQISVEPTNVEFVMAQVDINMRSGPGVAYPIIGALFGGQMARVTGVSADGAWWRVICPDDTVGNCFVTADPTLSQPATAPDGEQMLPPDSAMGTKASIYALP